MHPEDPADLHDLGQAASAAALLPDGDAAVADLRRRCLAATLSPVAELRAAALTILASRLRPGATTDLAVIKALLVGLADQSPEAARACAAGLGRLAVSDPLIAAALLTGLRGSAWELRPTCAHLLAPHAADATVAAALRRSLLDPDPTVRRAAAEAHGPSEAARRDPAAREALLHALADHNPTVRVAAAESLAAAREHAEVRAALLRGLDDIYGRLRVTCAAALGDLAASDPQVRAAFTTCLRDSYWPLRDLCAAALLQTGEWQDAPGGSSGGAPPVASATTQSEAGVSIPGPRHIPPSQLGLAQLRDGLRHPDPDVRLCCAHWLGTKAHDAEARSALCDALLGSGESDLDRLLPGWMLAPPSGRARAACALALGPLAATGAPAVEEGSGGSIDGLAARRALLEDLSDAHSGVREACARALSACVHHPAVREALVAAQRSDDPAVRDACTQALRRSPV